MEVTCPLCGQPAEGMPVDELPMELGLIYPFGPGETVQNARDMRASGHVLLHHGCTSPQADRDESPYWDPMRHWWACQDPERAIDQNACFELNCLACASRWEKAGKPGVGAAD